MNQTEERNNMQTIRQRCEFVNVHGVQCTRFADVLMKHYNDDRYGNVVETECLCTQHAADVRSKYIDPASNVTQRRTERAA